MKDGLIYIQDAFIDSPSLQDAVDNAPDLTGVNLSAPLLSNFSSTAADISRDTLDTFTTAPSLFSAVLKYILHYEFDVPEFLALLESLEEVRITASTKEDNVDVFSSPRTFREFDITSLSTGSPPEELGVFDAGDVSTQISTGSLNELLATIVAGPLLSKVPNRSLAEKFIAIDDSRPKMKRKQDFGNEVLYIPAVNIAEGRGELFSIAQDKATSDDFFSVSHTPLVFVGDIFTVKDIVDLVSSETLGYKPLEEFEVGIAASGNDPDGFPYCDPRMLPNYREFVNTASQRHFVGKVPSGGSVSDVFYMLPDEVRKKFALDVRFRGFKYGEGDPLEGQLIPPEEYRAVTVESARRKSNPTVADNFFSKVAKPVLGKNPQSFIENVFAESEKFGFNIGSNPFSRAATESSVRKRVPISVENYLDVKNFVVYKGKFAHLIPQKFGIESERRTNKIIIDFLVEKTFWSIHTDLAGFIVSASTGDYVWVDLGPEYDAPIYHSSVNFDDEGNPIDEDGNIYTPPNNGWGAGKPFYEINERYIQTTARSNMGRFRQGRESALYPEYRDRYGSAVANKLGEQYRVSGVTWAFTDDAIHRFGEYGVVSTDSARIKGENGEVLGLYFSGPGYGQNGVHGPAPLKWTYGYHGTSSNTKFWSRRDGPYYTSYIHTISHQDSGRRTNLLIREMTADDITASNRFGGKRQITTGPTFIDVMLGTAYWGKLFKLVQGLVQIQASHVKEDQMYSVERLNNIGLGPTTPVIPDKVGAKFLHRYESDLFPDPIYDVELKYTPGLHKERVWPDGNRDWRYNTSPWFLPQPAGWEPKVRLKYSFNHEDTSVAKSRKPFVFSGGARFEVDSALVEDLREANKFVKRVAYLTTRTPQIGVSPEGDPIYGPSVTTLDDESVYIVPATYAPILSGDGGDEVVVGYSFVKGETFSIARNNNVFDTATSKMLKAIITKAPKNGTLTDRIFTIVEPSQQKPSRLVEDEIFVKEPQGYYITQTIFNPETEQNEDIQVFIPKPEIAQKNNLLNEVAAADSGTAFVPVYCFPSYFMETYVGEDGKYANF